MASRCGWTASRRSALDLLSLPEVDFPALARIWPELGGFRARDRRAARNRRPICRLSRPPGRGHSRLPARRSADASRRPRLSRHPRAFDRSARQARKNPPATLGQAARIEGVTAAALTLVLAHVPVGAANAVPDNKPNSDRGVRARQAGVSRETLARLKAYAGCSTDWNARHNLVSAASLKDLWRRHFWDSAQLLALIPAGCQDAWPIWAAARAFPAWCWRPMLRAGRVPDRLFEATAKKAPFSPPPPRAWSWTVEIRNARIEDAGREPFDVVTARACAPLPGCSAMHSISWARGPLACSSRAKM